MVLAPQGATAQTVVCSTMGPANAKIINDTDHHVTVCVYNYLDSIRTVPGSKHKLRPGASANCEAAAHGIGLIFGIGNVYITGENGSTKKVSSLLHHGNGGFWNSDVSAGVKQARQLKNQAETAVKDAIEKKNKSQQAADEARQQQQAAKTRWDDRVRERDHCNSEKTKYENQLTDLFWKEVKLQRAEEIVKEQKDAVFEAEAELLRSL